MTLSQRLTRAGLTFILFGTVAAALPHQDDAAHATDDCTKPPATYRLTTDSGGNTPSTTTTISLTGANGVPKTVVLYTFFNTGATRATFSAVGSNFTATGAVTVNPAVGMTTTVTGTGTGSGVVTSTYTPGGITYTATENVVVAA